MIHVLNSPTDFQQYDHWVKTHPSGSLWQSLEWKKYQESLGRETKLYVEKEGNEIVASALVIIDRTTFGLSTWEIPRGPLANNQQSTINNQLLDHIFADAKKDKCFALYLSPPVPLPLEATSYKLQASKRHQQPTATRIINLQQSKEEILAQMKPKGRYNIRVAQKHGVEVQQSQDIEAFFKLVSETTKRDKFKGHSKEHYRKFLTKLENSFMLLAYLPESRSPNPEVLSPNPESIIKKASHHKKKPIAGLLGVFWGETGTYYYGASSASQRAVMAPYVLQWESMLLSKARGYTSYDLFGIAPTDAPDSHPWKGVSAFKEKFGGYIISYPSEKMIVIKPLVNVLLTLKRIFF
ncbi:peptidoglycan bridge formation glycyltransferase FemA/FemB family protein [Patescibacteria group bacterium]|nr:peptidoglycan bridge formation glycyltransferase FemA/FemB family protein [Patescibacteria group bacterium]